MPNVTTSHQDGRYWRMSVVELAIANALVRRDMPGDHQLPKTLSHWFQRDIDASDIEPVLDGLLERALLQPDHGLGLFHSALFAPAFELKETSDD